MVTALGRTSPKLDAVRALRTKRGRSEQGRFAFEGPTLLAEAVAAGAPIEAVYASEAGLEALDRTLVGSLTCPIYVVPVASLLRLSDLKTPPGVVATTPLALLTPDRLLRDGGDALLLAGVSDPGNAGTLLRSAEAFGIRSVLFAEGSVEAYNPKVVRAAMGATFRLGLGVAPLDGIVAAARDLGYAVVAADRSGAPASEFRFPVPSLVAIGGERAGLTALLPACDSVVSIPHFGQGESLNAAVAGSIVLYELAKRRSDLSRGLSTRQKP